MSVSLDDIKSAMSNLVNLDIRTIVGEYDYAHDGKIKANQDAKQIVTRMNLLDGDITTAFSEEFLEAPLDSVRGFHGLRERQGMEIVQGNIRALQQMVSLIGTLAQEEKRTAGKSDTEDNIGTSSLG